jgi:hypothetical protein
MLAQAILSFGLILLALIWLKCTCALSNLAGVNVALNAICASCPAANLAQVHLHFIQSCSRESGTQRNLCHVPVALKTLMCSTPCLVDVVMHLEHGSHNTHDCGFVGLCSRETF